MSERYFPEVVFVGRDALKGLVAMQESPPLRYTEEYNAAMTAAQHAIAQADGLTTDEDEGER